MQASTVVQSNYSLFVTGEELREKVAVSLDTPLCATMHDQLFVQKNTRASPTKQLSSKKKVTFAPHDPISVPSNYKEISESDRKELWYDQSDLHSIRLKARSLAMRIHANRQKTDFEYSYAQTMEKAFKHGCSLSEDEELKLWTWFSKAHARRGLERLSCNHVGRNQHAKAAVKKVLQTQRALTNAKTDRNVKAHLLACVSEGETGQARALAQVFGRADMVAATMDLESML